MKLLKKNQGRRNGFMMLLVLIIIGCSLLIMGSTMRRTSAVASLNQHYNQLLINNNAAEAAVEKVYAHIAYDFQSYGVAGVTNNLPLYRSMTPVSSENPYWTNFVFSDGQGTSNATYAAFAYTYNGALPSSYPGLFAASSPVYRIVSNVTTTNGYAIVTGTAQEDVLLGLVPLTTWAIFYNGLLEFTMCATMNINGRVQCNGSIYVGTTSSAHLTFNSGVSATGTLTSPANDGNGPWTTGNWNTTFNNKPQYTTNVASVSVSLSMTNSHFLIEIPPTWESAMSITGQQRLYNKAQMLLTISNAASTSPMFMSNLTLFLTLQVPPSSGQVAGADPNKVTYIYTNITTNVLAYGVTNRAPNLLFLTLTNSFYDQREYKTNIVTDIDVGKLAGWLSTNPFVLTKLPQTPALGIYPTILYVADLRTNFTDTKHMSVVRLSNGNILPYNNDLGFSVATMNPLYIWGNYNIQIAGVSGTSSGSTNVVYTVPSAFLSDAITMLSPNWTDSQSKSAYQKGLAADTAADMTVNAAIITGTVPTTGTDVNHFSGGVHNLPRLLEDWSNNTLYLNTSILRLWDSQVATNQFRDPSGFTPAPVSPYYNPPTRDFSFNLNYLNPAQVPPGVPYVLVPMRFAWYQPPPGVVTNTPAHD